MIQVSPFVHFLVPAQFPHEPGLQAAITAVTYKTFSFIIILYSPSGLVHTSIFVTRTRPVCYLGQSPWCWELVNGGGVAVDSIQYGH